MELEMASLRMRLGGLLFGGAVLGVVIVFIRVVRILRGKVSAIGTEMA
jgi:hypothetical protein